MKTHTIIDTFVHAINLSPEILYPLESHEIPPYLRVSESHEEGFYNWKICHKNGAQWIDPVLQTLPIRVPPSYYSLISRYAFAEIQFPALMLFANTGEQVRWELASQLIAPRSFSSLLLQHGFVQVGIPYDGNIDPICFKTHQGRRETPLVRLDHEALIRFSEIRITQQIAPSFLTFVKEFISSQNDTSNTHHNE